MAANPPIHAIRKTNSRAKKNRPIWSVLPADDVQAMMETLAGNSGVGGFNRNHCLNQALRVGLKSVLRQQPNKSPRA